MKDGVNNFIDERGLVHHLPDPTTDSSENELMYSALYIWLRYLTGEKLDFTMRKAMIKFYKEEIRHERHMSHDNRTSVASLTVTGDHLPINSLGNRKWWHPRDLAYWGARKYRRTSKEKYFTPFLFITSIAMILSCYQTYKVRNGKKIVKTDGKLLTFIRCHSLNMHRTLKICTWLIRRNPKFGSWTNVARIYFKEEGHPIPELMEKWEASYGTETE